MNRLLTIQRLLMALTLVSPLCLSPPWWPWIGAFFVAQVVGVLAALVVMARELDRAQKALAAWRTPFGPQNREEIKIFIEEGIRVETEVLRHELEETRATLEQVFTASEERTAAEQKVLEACGALARRLDPERLRVGKYVKRADQILLAELVELVRLPDREEPNALP